MRVPSLVVAAILKAVRAPRLAAKREPDFSIGPPDNRYMFRWWVIQRNRWFNIYLHHIVRSDEDRALHDHPWWNVSILLEGGYVEHTIAAGGINMRTMRLVGDLAFRLGQAAHRLELIDGRPCWTLFVTGPRFRRWGFHCPLAGWVFWEDFNAADDKGVVGRGCGE